MQNFATYFAELTEAKAQTEVERLKAIVAQHPNSGHSGEDIETLFKLMHGLHFVNDVAKAASIFQELEGIIHVYRENSDDEATGLDYYYEWSTMALQLTPESLKEFVSTPLYRELLETFDNGPEKLRYRGVLIRMQLLRHYNYWLGKGAQESALPEEDLAFINAATASYEDKWDEAFDFAEANEDNEVLVKLFRNAAQFYLQENQPNDAIACLKDALEYLPKTPDYHPVDSADLLMQIGQLFMAFRKYDVAIRYFNEALEIYQNGGKETEMLVFQAEGWIEEANKKKAM